jgi:hypothetical protein
MKRKNLIAVMALTVLASFGAMAQNTATDVPSASQTITITFQDGSCHITDIDLRPMWAPAGIKENEKAFSLRFEYALKDGADSKVTSILYDKGQFVAPDGKIYKAGAAMSNKEKFTYTLTVAIPKDLDVETLCFVFDGQKVPLKPFIKK